MSTQAPPTKLIELNQWRDIIGPLAQYNRRVRLFIGRRTVPTIGALRSKSISINTESDNERVTMGGQTYNNPRASLRIRSIARDLCG